VYALAAVLCEALTGTVPFEGDSDVAKMLAIMSQPRPVLSERVGTLPSEIDAVVARAMAINPAYRYPSAGDFARAVHGAIHARPVVVPERAVARGAAALAPPSSPEAFPPPAPAVPTPGPPLASAPGPAPPAPEPPSQPTALGSPMPALPRSAELDPQPARGRLRGWVPAGIAVVVALIALGALIALLMNRFG
jgi:serine/threonine-protein kinase